MASGPTPENARLIGELRARGMSYRAIDRALGYGGSGRLSKYAAETKPAANLTGPLRALVAGSGAPPAPARRMTKAGTPARVRQPVVRVKEGGVRKRGGVVVITGGPDTVLIKREIREAAKAGRTVSIVARVTMVKRYGRAPENDAEVSVYEKGGASAAGVLAAMNAAQSWAAGMRTLIGRKPGIEEVGKVTRITLTIV